MESETDPPNPNTVREDARGHHYRLCHAHNRSGQPCQNSAVKGANVCEHHGGRSPQVLDRIARDEAEEKARKVLVKYRRFAPRDVSPSEALLEEVRRTAGYVAWLDHRVASLTEEDLSFGVSREMATVSDQGRSIQRTKAAELSVWVKWLGDERDRLVKVCEAAIRAGIEERRVSLAEQQGALLASVVENILDGVRAGLVSRQVDVAVAWEEIVREVVPRELRAAAVT